jgi:hypothetical protein
MSILVGSYYLIVFCFEQLFLIVLERKVNFFSQKAIYYVML